MSEPTSGNQKPDPEQENDGVQDQDESAGPVYSDPTAPVWADPTAPIPPQPSPTPQTPPGAGTPQEESPYGAPASAPSTPAPAAPTSNPYAQQPPAQPYGQPAEPYGQPADPYAQGQSGQQYPAYGQQYPAYGQQSYQTGPSTDPNASAIVLTILSAIVMLSTCFIVGVPSLVFGIMALTSNSTDPMGSRKKAKTGWILFAANVGVVVVLGVILTIALIALSSTGSNTNFGY